MRTFKGLLLEMKLAPTNEEKILAEETLVNEIEALQSRLKGQVLWIDEVAGSTQPKFVLGTTAGLFLSTDGGVTWMVAKNGIPVGRMEAWLATPAYWLVSERSGGLYLSSDEGASWTRIDRDDERGRVAGLVGLGGGGVVVGSQSEGLLRWSGTEK